MVEFDVREVETWKGNTVVSVAQFNGGDSHIIVDGSCWVVMQKGNFTPWVSKEAAAILKQLPASPKQYGPYKRFVSRLALVV